MFSKTAIFNIFLTAIVMFSAFKARSIWTDTESEPTFVENRTKALSAPKIKIFQQNLSPASAYRVIVDRNLFSEDRKEFVPEKIEIEKKPVEEKPLVVSGRKITLYGVMLMKNYQSALISNPIKGLDEPRDRWVRMGEQLGELSVLKITKDSILLKDNKQTYTVLLYDKKKKKRIGSAKPANQPTTVVITQPEKKQNKPVTAKHQQADSKGDEYETVHTPFGKFKRKKRN